MKHPEFFFYFFAGLTIASAGLILFTRNILYAAFGLLASLLGIAALYVFAGADFLAVAQIMIYVGGVLLLILFGIMLTPKPHHSNFKLSENRSLIAGLTSFATVAIAATFFWMKADFSLIMSQGKSSLYKSTIGLTGFEFMTDYILPFEIAAILLLIALIGAAFIAGKSFRK